MSKMIFQLPLVLTTKGGIGGGDATEEAPGSGQGSVDPVSWNIWQQMYQGGFDMDKDGDIDQTDYYLWWIANGFTQAQWEAANNNPNDPAWPGSNP